MKWEQAPHRPQRQIIYLQFHWAQTRPEFDSVNDSIIDVFLCAKKFPDSINLNPINIYAAYINYKALG